MIESILIHALSVYAATLVIASSYAMKSARRLFREIVPEVLPWCVARHFVMWDADAKDPLNGIVLVDREEMDMSEEHHYHGYDFLSCRLCLGAWVTVLACAWTLPVYLWPAVYGASYFLTTQER